MGALDEFASEFDRCWLCGTMARNTWPPKLEIHHIVRGQNRKKAREERCALIRSCQRCHQVHLDSMPIAAQLALKLRNDHAYYMREKVNVLRGRAPGAITDIDVGKAVSEFDRMAEETESDFPFPRWRW